MTHLAAKEIEQFVEGNLSPRAAVRIARHIDACPDCRNLVQEQDPIHTLCALDTETELSAQFLDELVSTANNSRPAVFQRIPLMEVLLAGLILLPSLSAVFVFTDLTLYRALPVASEIALLASKIGSNHYIQGLMFLGALLSRQYATEIVS